MVPAPPVQGTRAVFVSWTSLSPVRRAIRYKGFRIGDVHAVGSRFSQSSDFRLTIFPTVERQPAWHVGLGTGRLQSGRSWRASPDWLAEQAMPRSLLCRYRCGLYFCRFWSHLAP